VFDPAGLRKDLPEFLLTDRDDRGVVIENDGARAGGALIEREYVRHGWNLLDGAKAGPILTKQLQTRARGEETGRKGPLGSY
jgi:hypothetical protein